MRRKERAMSEEKCCGTCRHCKNDGTDWYCGNTDCDYYSIYTDYDEGKECEEWEEKSTSMR